MTNEETLKALIQCAKSGNTGDCGSCPLLSMGEVEDCTAELSQNALNFISLQSVEIDRLKSIIDGYATSARTIALYTDKFCNKSLPYDKMISDAVVKLATENERIKSEYEQLKSEMIKAGMIMQSMGVIKPMYDIDISDDEVKIKRTDSGKYSLDEIIKLLKECEK